MKNGGAARRRFTVSAKNRRGVHILSPSSAREGQDS